MRNNIMSQTKKKELKMAYALDSVNQGWEQSKAVKSKTVAFVVQRMRTAEIAISPTDEKVIHEIPMNPQLWTALQQFMSTVDNDYVLDSPESGCFFGLQTGSKEYNVSLQFFLQMCYFSDNLPEKKLTSIRQSFWSMGHSEKNKVQIEILEDQTKQQQEKINDLEQMITQKEEELQSTVNPSQKELIKEELEKLYAERSGVPIQQKHDKDYVFEISIALITLLTLIVGGSAYTMKK